MAVAMPAVVLGLLVLTPVVTWAQLPVPPDLRGASVGAGTVNQTGCRDPRDNGVREIAAVVNAVSQGGLTVSGSANFRERPAGTPEQDGQNTGSFNSGSVTFTVVLPAALSGSFPYTHRRGSGVADRTGTSTITGQATPGGATIQIAFDDTAGDTCRTTGSIPLVLANPVLAASVLPSSRSVQVGTPATAFVTVINTATTDASGVGISLRSDIEAGLTFQTTNPQTNVLTGTPNTPVTIPAGGSRTFLISLTPAGPFGSTDVQLNFVGTTSAASTITGVNTLRLSASTTLSADVVALAATIANDGIVNVPAAIGSGAFSVATVNVGAAGMITASADTGGAALAVALALCETNPTTGACTAPPSPTVNTPMNAGETRTFGIFVNASGPVPFDAASNRVFVRFTDAGGVTRGSTSVAVRTQ